MEAAGEAYIRDLLDYERGLPEISAKRYLVRLIEDSLLPHEVKRSAAFVEF